MMNDHTTVFASQFLPHFHLLLLCSYTSLPIVSSFFLNIQLTHIANAGSEVHPRSSHSPRTQPRERHLSLVRTISSRTRQSSANSFRRLFQRNFTQKARILCQRTRIPFKRKATGVYRYQDSVHTYHGLADTTNVCQSRSHTIPPFQSLCGS